MLSLNGTGAWQACSPITGLPYVNLTHGKWIFKVRGTNALGVVTNPPSEAWFTVDLVGPLTFFTSRPAAFTTSQTADFVFKFNEPNAGPVLCALDGGLAAACPSLTYHAVGLAPGVHKLVVTAIDAYGNWGSTPVSWTIDRTAPVVTRGGPAGTIGPNPVIKLSANEPVKWIFWLDGQPPFDGDPAIMYLYSLADGPHTLISRAYDTAGNLSPVITQSWTQVTPPATPAPLTAPSTSPPTVTIQSGPSPQTSSGIAAFSFTANQPDATFACSLDGGGFGPCASGVFYDDLPGGNHTFAVRATSPGGTGPAANWSWTITP
jgi:hypothetical protein